MSEYEDETEGGVAVKSRSKLKRPKRYKVLLHNDDYTTMEFVIYILKKFFNKTPDESEAIMLKIHHEGVAVCGVYTFEIAESKADRVMKSAESEGHPLMCTIEAE